MKNQIDALVRSIRHALEQSPPTVPEVAALLQATGMDGPSRAGAQLAVLARWADDPDFEEREYAQQQLDALLSLN
ncbi:hypothetical protein [Hylemonella gracilis]|nr:hypothetical protein [Hylemonella gracilis]